MSAEGSSVSVHSVSDITRYIKGMFQAEPVLGDVMVRGELSNFKRYPSGHCYFTMKDAKSSLKCVMFRSRAQALRFEPQNGMEVIAAGNVSVYERDGVYQLYADSLIPQGTGDLSLAFEQLKGKLQEEGLFAAEHKQQLPPFPQTIGVVTSSAGAVLRDIYHVAKRRNPQIRLVLYPVQVQGEGAAAAIAAGIGFFNAHYPVDVIIAGRGGGSIEDLWAFNEEAVVRAVYASEIPIVSAVGHETDFTLSDFAADVRAATPSQAAELTVPDTEELLRHVDGLQERLQSAAENVIRQKQSRLQLCLASRLLRLPQDLLAEKRQRLDLVSEKLRQEGRAGLQHKQHALAVQMGKLSVLDPAHVLQRGYGMMLRQDGSLVHGIADAAAGEKLLVRLADGSLKVRVEQVMKSGGI
jgi:exodeoxyribonuclease VII large subunit